MNAKKASMNLRRSGVCCKYDFRSADTVCETPEDVACEDVFEPAMLRVYVELVRAMSTENGSPSFARPRSRKKSSARDAFLFSRS